MHFCDVDGRSQPFDEPRGRCATRRAGHREITRRRRRSGPPGGQESSQPLERSADNRKRLPGQASAPSRLRVAFMSDGRGAAALRRACQTANRRRRMVGFPSGRPVSFLTVETKAYQQGHEARRCRGTRRLAVRRPRGPSGRDRLALEERVEARKVSAGDLRRCPYASEHADAEAGVGLGD